MRHQDYFDTSLALRRGEKPEEERLFLSYPL